MRWKRRVHSARPVSRQTEHVHTQQYRKNINNHLCSMCRVQAMREGIHLLISCFSAEFACKTNLLKSICINAVLSRPGIAAKGVAWHDSVFRSFIWPMRFHLAMEFGDLNQEIGFILRAKATRKRGKRDDGLTSRPRRKSDSAKNCAVHFLDDFALVLESASQWIL